MLLAGFATACTPAMNWRETPLDGMSILLPCKPDRAQRRVHLAEQDVPLTMAGCEAAGVLFAITHVVVAGETAASTMAAWRSITLANMQATVTTEVAVNRIATQGKRPDGTPVQAQLAWIVAGHDIYQIAVYADRLTPDMLDNLFSEIKVQ